MEKIEHNNDKKFEILERVCASTTDGHHYLMLQAQDQETSEIFWAIGDEQVCAVTSADFIRNADIAYNDVLIQEISYRDHSPESTGTWKPLIKALAECTMEKYLEHDGLVHVYPQWLPDDMGLTMGRESFEDMRESLDHVILYADHMMEMVSKEQGQSMV